MRWIAMILVLLPGVVLATPCKDVLARYRAKLEATNKEKSKALRKISTSYLKGLEGAFPGCFKQGKGAALKAKRLKSEADRLNFAKNRKLTPCQKMHREYGAKLGKAMGQLHRSRQITLGYLEALEKTKPKCFKSKEGKALHLRRLKMEKQSVAMGDLYAPAQTQGSIDDPLRSSAAKSARGLRNTGIALLVLGIVGGAVGATLVGVAFSKPRPDTDLATGGWVVSGISGGVTTLGLALLIAGSIQLGIMHRRR